MPPAAQADWINRNSDFAYDAAGFPRLGAFDNPGDVVVAHEKYDHGGAGSAVGYADGHADFLKPEALKQALFRASRIRFDVKAKKGFRRVRQAGCGSTAPSAQCRNAMERL